MIYTLCVALSMSVHISAAPLIRRDPKQISLEGAKDSVDKVFPKDAIAAASDEKEVGNSKVNSSDHRHQFPIDETDYRDDVANFLRLHPQLPCRLPRVSVSEMNTSWASLLGQNQNRANSVGSFQPWLHGEEVAERSWRSQVRAMIAQEVFQGPGIVQGLADAWMAPHRWEEKKMRKRVRGIPFRVMGFDYHHDWHDNHKDTPLTFHGMATLDEYLDQNRSKRNEYLFLDMAEMSQRKFHSLGYEAMMDDLRKDYEPLPSFTATYEEQAPILAVDGIASGHGLHFHGPVWQTQIVGRKAWWFLPDSVSVAPHSRIPVVNGVQYEDTNPCVYLQKSKPPPGAELCVVGPGETLLLPHDHWHSTCGLDTYTVSIGGFQSYRGKARPGSEAKHNYRGEAEPPLKRSALTVVEHRRYP